MILVTLNTLMIRAIWGATERKPPAVMMLWSALMTMSKREDTTTKKSNWFQERLK